MVVQALRQQFLDAGASALSWPLLKRYHSISRAASQWEHGMDVRTRDWECVCGHKWTAPIELSDAINQNIKGEKTVLCPKCNERPLYGSQAKERSKWITPSSEAETKAVKPI